MSDIKLICTVVHIRLLIKLTNLKAFPNLNLVLTILVFIYAPFFEKTCHDKICNSHFYGNYKVCL